MHNADSKTRTAARLQPGSAQTPVHTGEQSAFFQPKLTVNQPGDSYEQEADQVADKVVQRLAENKAAMGPTEKTHNQDTVQSKIQRIPITPIQRSVIQAKCASCEKEEQLQKKEDEDGEVQGKLQRKPIFDSAAEPPDDGGNLQRKPNWGAVQMKCATCAQEEDPVQRAESANAAPTPSPDFSSRLQSSKGGGSPLPADVSSSMGEAMGADFSNVRVHTGSEAAGMSNSIQAQAFTHGNDVYFNEGKYSPSSSDGKRLLAHELVHTVQQGASLKRKTNSKTEAPTIQRSWLSDGLNWVKNQIKEGLNWAAERLIPGYSLLNVILGKNLITDAPVERSGVNIVKAYMRLVPVIGSILLSELEETSTLTKAGTWTEEQVAKFGINFDDIARRLTTMWDEMSVIRGIDYNVAIFKRYIGPVLGRFLAFSSVMEQKMKELRLEGALRLVGAAELLTTLQNAPEAFKRMADNPSLILTNFMDALKKGFSAFKDNFASHFKNALFGWLLGKAASMGIQMPKEFSIAGVFHLVAQIAGLTYDQIKAYVIQKLGPRFGPKAAKVFEAIEKGVAIVKRVITEGPIALWEMLKEKLANLKEMVLSQITQLVTTEIIKAAVTKLLSMLNPAGALIQLVMTLYRVIKFFIDNWATIKEIATGIISSISKVALGQLGEAANFVENILAKGVQLIISFLARIFGLSDIADKVKELIKKFTGIIAKGRDYVVDWLVAQGSRFINAITGRSNEPTDNRNQGRPDLAAVEQSIESQGREKSGDGEMSRGEADEIAANVRRDNANTIGSITVIDGGATWDFEYVQRANKLQILKQNQLTGRQFEDQVENDLKTAGYFPVVSQVSIKPINGTKRTRIDFMTKLQGKTRLVEAKGSSTAPLTRNQRQNYTGVTSKHSTGIQVQTLGQDHEVVGTNGGTSFQVGMQIPASTILEIRRP